jgi:hypothetical protein
MYCQTVAYAQIFLIFVRTTYSMSVNCFVAFIDHTQKAIYRILIQDLSFILYYIGKYKYQKYTISPHTGHTGGNGFLCNCQAWQCSGAYGQCTQRQRWSSTVSQNNFCVNHYLHNLRIVPLYSR